MNPRFTNKIQSSLPGWAERLVAVADTFNSFDGERYDYKDLKGAFQALSTRIPGQRDEADFRDEFGAYGKFLSLFYEVRSPTGVIIRSTTTAKELLLRTEPDVAAFLRLLLPLFQYPNGIGLKWTQKGPTLEWQSQNSRRDQLRAGKKIAPFRLILQILHRLLVSAGPAQAYLTGAEIVHSVFSSSRIGLSLSGVAPLIAEDLLNDRASLKTLPRISSDDFRNYHILEHTGLVERVGKSFRLAAFAPNDARLAALERISNLTAEFNGLDDLFHFQGDDAELKVECLARLSAAQWNRYYDALGEGGFEPDTLGLSETFPQVVEIPQGLRPYEPYDATPKYSSPKRLADPEETRVWMERANLDHLMAQRALCIRLTALGAKPKFSTLIDLFAMLDRPYIFEVKSINENNFVSQVRKAVAQLYEYRYREGLPANTQKVIVLASEPVRSPEWMLPYLETDRGIAVSWVDNSGNIGCTARSRTMMDGIPSL